MYSIFEFLLLPAFVLSIPSRNVTCRQNLDAKDFILSPAGTERLTVSSKHSCCAIGLEHDSVSIFYNSLTYMCQLNSIKVDVSPGSSATKEQGWEMYTIKDVSCPSTYVVDADAGICFKIYGANSSFNSYTDFQNSCKVDGAEPLLVDNSQKELAIKNHVEQDRNSYTDYLLIQGQRHSYTFVDDNGDALTYFNWDWPSEPGIYELYLAIAKVYNYKWHDVTHQLSSSNYICEVKV